MSELNKRFFPESDNLDCLGMTKTFQGMEYHLKTNYIKGKPHSGLRIFPVFLWENACRGYEFPIFKT